jgi:hypothetical protein
MLGARGGDPLGRRLREALLGKRLPAKPERDARAADSAERRFTPRMESSVGFFYRSALLAPRAGHRRFVKARPRRVRLCASRALAQLFELLLLARLRERFRS